MDSYDPDVAPDAQAWLLLGEQERSDLVLAHHAEADTPLPNARLHAAIHVVVENQLALGDPAAVRDAMERLQREQLSRHDAVHAIGTAVSELLLELSDTSAGDPKAALDRYVEKLKGLSGIEFLKRNN